MKKVALVFALAVLTPSLVLAVLAVRSLRDQQMVCEQKETLLCQGVADALAKEVEQYLNDRQHEFGLQVESLTTSRRPVDVAPTFDEQLRTNWPLAEVGFVVTLNGQMLAPSALSCARYPESRLFAAGNGTFLANRESAEVYWNSKMGINPNLQNNQSVVVAQNNANANDGLSSSLRNNEAQLGGPSLGGAVSPYESKESSMSKNAWAIKGQQRAVAPQQFLQAQAPSGDNFSKVAPAETEFHQLIGGESDGSLARFVDDKLSVLLWHRSPRDQDLVFGAQVSLPRLVSNLQPIMQTVEPALSNEICAAILDDKARPVATTVHGFRANWKRPYVATEIGEALPHWEAAIYLLDPGTVYRSARTAKLTLGLLICVLVMAIGVGSWLVVQDLNRQLRLARQKTDFVSNVSHELKTPLTSIRMFAELLSEGRVPDAVRQRSYLNIITAETARLTRLINNVLDFGRIERGEMKYNFQKCDLAAMVRETAATCRPHLESQGFKFDCPAPKQEVWVNGDRDALAQVVMNLLSNAEKYSDSRKEIVLELQTQPEPLPYAEVKVMDRGLGVPKGSEERIFEQFYRAHDSLNSGIQGSGLGLTLARQIARAHGGEVVYGRREGGGSCFNLRVPLVTEQPRRASS